MMIRKTALALAALASLGFAAPAFAAASTTSTTVIHTAPAMKVAQVDVRVRRPIVRHHRRHPPVCRTVTVKSWYRGHPVWKKVRRCR